MKGGRKGGVALQKGGVGGAKMKTKINRKKRVACRKRDQLRERERMERPVIRPSPVCEGINSGPLKGPGHLQSLPASRLLYVLPSQMPGLRPRPISP